MPRWKWSTIKSCRVIRTCADIAYAWACVRTTETQALLERLCGMIEDVGNVSATLYGEALLMLALGRMGDPFANSFLKVMKTLAKSKQFNTFNLNADFGHVVAT